MLTGVAAGLISFLAQTWLSRRRQIRVRCERAAPLLIKLELLLKEAHPETFLAIQKERGSEAAQDWLKVQMQSWDSLDQQVLEFHHWLSWTAGLKFTRDLVDSSMRFRAELTGLSTAATHEDVVRHRAQALVAQARSRDTVDALIKYLRDENASDRQ